MKLPEPVNADLANDISAIDAMHRGDPSYEHDVYYMRRAAEKLVRNGYAVYTEAQYKQGQRDALEAAAKVCDARHHATTDGAAAVIRKLMEGL